MKKTYTFSAIGLFLSYTPGHTKNHYPTSGLNIGSPFRPANSHWHVTGIHANGTNDIIGNLYLYVKTNENTTFHPAPSRGEYTPRFPKVPVRQNP